MRTPTDTQIHDAVRRVDADRLSGLLDTGHREPAVLGRLIRHEDPALRGPGLVLLDEHVTSGGPFDEAEGERLAALLPATLTGQPESDLLLAGLYERLAPYLRDRPRPAWRTADPPARVRIAWLRADLLHDPSLIRDEPRGELLYQAIRDTDLTRAPRPARLVDELAGSGDPVLRAEALRLARRGLRAGLLAPARVRRTLTALLGADDDPVVTDALRELAEPWAATEPLPPRHLAPFLAAGPPHPRPGTADAALLAAARHGHQDLLWRALDTPELAPGTRRRAMELLGESADRDAVGALTALAASDPLLLGGPAVTCLRGLHRRGHFVTGPHVPAVIGLALADHAIPADEVTTILYTCREEALRELTDAAPGALSWPRRLDLLVSLARQGVGELPVGAAITRLLPSAPAPGPFLHAIRALRHTRAEEAVLALLPSAPAPALDALEAIGGKRTVRVLRAALGPAGAPAAPHLRAVRHRAVELLWQLTTDPEQRQDLLTRLDPLDLPPRVAAGLGGPDERELALLSARPDRGDPVAALCRTAAHGTAGSLPAVADLLLRVVADAADAREHPPVPGARGTAWPGGPAGTHAADRPGAEPVVPRNVLDAVHGLGRRLYERGAIRPVCLLDAADAEQAGHALVATTVLDLLDRPGLTDPERAILLEALLGAPWPGTRSRVHRLLRHRDRHVRKHVIALLARDSTGEDAQALSASLIALTGAGDIQTVRQALLALGHAEAHWASGAIAARLDHPNMNIRKTAARALARAGTPEAVPRLLHRLGHHDNPGLRDSLVAALRAVLGDAYAATLLAAAERAPDDRTRTLLLEGLHGTLASGAVLALDDQESPVAAPLLALVAAGRVALASGTVAELAAALARHGIAAPAGADGPPTDDTAEPDVAALVARGWDSATALRLAGRSGALGAGQRERLRPLLGDWLRLAAARPASRSHVVRLVLRVCPAPRTADERVVCARSLPVLLDALAVARDEHRHDLIALLEEVAPTLPAVRGPAAVAAVRALRPAPATPHRSTLTLLRRLGAVLLRTDLDHALASARLGGDPWDAVTAVLREAFGTPEPAAASAAPPSAGLRAWREALRDAVRGPDALAEFRRRDDGAVGSRERLAALIDAHHGAGPGIRDALLDWMEALQPLDAPPWTLAETARTPAPEPRRIRPDDLDQPRSAPLRKRLLAMLESPAADRRETAARALATWPGHRERLPVLRAFLRGRVDLPVEARLAHLLTSMEPAELSGDDILRERVARVARKLDATDREGLVPLLLEWWEQAPAAERPALADTLRAHPADALAEFVQERFAAGARGCLDLILDRELLRTPALTRTRERLRAEGHDALADRLVLVDGPLRGPDAARRDAAAREAPRAPLPAAPAPRPHRPSRRALLDLARTGSQEQACRALTELAETHPGPEPDRDPALRALLDELLRHPRARVRLRAHRTSRAMLDRDTHLGHTALLLDDPRPDVTRMAVRTLCRAGWAPAAPAVTALLTHSHPVVRGAAAEGLAALGEAAVPALRRAADHARPDRRARYTSVLDRITAERAPEPPDD
ncbi:HEAT repeat domain-containing protein [Streptomyces sp. NPDC014734]|uniref:HEAT repeat domain-containing protein n=1 Tax=Streptomyces sp. NPDC014734 TaxID=3364886 RepID=UPI0037024AD9